MVHFLAATWYILAPLSTPVSKPVSEPVSPLLKSSRTVEVFDGPKADQILTAHGRASQPAENEDSERGRVDGVAGGYASPLEIPKPETRDETFARLKAANPELYDSQINIMVDNEGIERLRQAQGEWDSFYKKHGGGWPREEAERRHKEFGAERGAW